MINFIAILIKWSYLSDTLCAVFRSAVLFCVVFKLESDWKVKTVLGLCTMRYLKMEFFVFDKLEKYGHKCDINTGFCPLG
jgi:hypothetical protein